MTLVCCNPYRSKRQGRLWGRQEVCAVWYPSARAGGQQACQQRSRSPSPPAAPPAQRAARRGCPPLPCPCRSHWHLCARVHKQKEQMCRNLPFSQPCTRCLPAHAVYKSAAAGKQQPYTLSQKASITRLTPHQVADVHHAGSVVVACCHDQVRVDWVAVHRLDLQGCHKEQEGAIATMRLKPGQAGSS